MDYQKIYTALIDHAKTTQSNGYTELHHIVPKCLGGSDDPSNLVRLTAKQHFVAHHLLFKIHRTIKLAYAWHTMCRIGKGQEERRINARMFAKARATIANLLSEESKGSKNNFYGKTHREESRSKMSNSHKNAKRWENFTEEHKANLLASQKKPKTPEHKARIGVRGLIMLQHISTGEIVRVDKNDENYKTPEWVNPRKLKPEAKLTCVHCNVTSTAGNIKRWHNDNCKHA